MLELYCRKCGKLFIPAPQHIYKDHKGIYCSWTCFNHKDDGTLLHIPKVRLHCIEQRSLDGELIKEFQSATTAAEYINGTANGIRISCRNGNRYKGYYWRYVK